MKKVYLFLTALMLTLCLTSCFFGSETSIEIADLPNNVFNITDENDIENTLSFKLRVLEDGKEKYVLSYPNDKDVIKISNFDTTKNAGTYTAIVEYDGVRVTFQYTLVSDDSGMYDGQKLFTAGTGTEKDPFVISTSAEFLNISKVRNYSADVNYVLASDIDFNGIASENEYYIYWFKGNIDGQGHALKNFNGENARYLFRYLSKGTIQNVDIHSTGCFTVAYSDKANKSESLVLKNVNRYGEYQDNEGGNNFGFYISYIGEGGSSYSGSYGYVTFDDCDNYANLYGFTAYSAAYVGFATYKGEKSTLKFVNCDNYAVLEGQRVSMFAANGSANYLGKMVIENCSNKGEIRGTINAQLIYAIGRDDSTLFTDEEFANGAIKTITGTDTIRVSGVSKGKIRKLNVSGISVKLGEAGSKIEVTCANTEVASVVVFGYYYGKSLTNSTNMSCVFESFKGFGNAANNTVTASRLVNAQVKGCDAAQVKELMEQGCKFTNVDAGNTVLPWLIGDELYYLHSNMDSYKVNGVAGLTWTYIALDAQGNVIGGGQVK